MRNLFKKIGVFFVSLILTISFLPASKVFADDENCAEWTLYARNASDEEVAVRTREVNSQFNYPDPKQPPPSPNLPQGFSNPRWECARTYTSGTAADKEATEDAFDACNKAARISSNFGWLANNNLPNIKIIIPRRALDGITNFLVSTVSSTTGIDIRNLRDRAGNYLAGVFNNNVVNPLKGKIDNEINKLKRDLANKIAGEAKRKIENIASSIVSTEVPTVDKTTAGKVEEVTRKQDEQLGEQKRAERLAQTRAKCNELLKTTTATIKKALLYQFSTQINDWIQTGKKPQFLSQPGRFLEDTGRLAVDRLISRVAPELCEPFRFQIKAQILAASSIDRRVNPFYEQARCSLDKVVENVENFYSDFRSGGWIGYHELFLKPQNNQFGASILVREQALKEKAAAIDNAKLIQERGYTAQTECTQWVKYVRRTASTGGIFQKQSVDGIEFMVADNQDPEVNNGNGPLDQKGNPVGNIFHGPLGNTPGPPNGPIKKGDRYWKQDANGEKYFWECLETKITNPASTAANLSEKATQTDIDYLANTDDIESFLKDIENTLINKLVKSGIKGLQELLPDIIP
jgi:hypothetical protein